MTVPKCHSPQKEVTEYVGREKPKSENEEVKSERTLTAGLCLALDCPLVDVLDLNNKEKICFAHTDSLTVYLTTHTSICRFMQPLISDFMFSLGCEGLFRSLK